MSESKEMTAAAAAEERVDATEEKRKNVNGINARGRVLGIGKDNYGRPRFILFIRANSSRPASYVSFSLDKISLGDIRVGDFVDVEGHIVAYNTRSRVWDRNIYTQYMVADKVELCRTRLKKIYGFDGGFAFDRPYIDVYVSGKVTDIESREGRNTLSILVEEKGKRPNTINVQYSDRMRVNDVKPSKGDEICLVGTIYTKKTDKDGSTRYYENIIVDDMGIVVKEEEADSTLFDFGEENGEKE